MIVEPDDVDGSVHLYPQEQLEYFKRQWERKEYLKKKDAPNMATKTLVLKHLIRRSCCNGKCLSIKTDENGKKVLECPQLIFMVGTVWSIGIF